MKKIIFPSGAILILGIAFFAFNGCTLLSAAGLNSQGLSAKKAPQPLISTTENSSVNLDHSAWDALLKKYVNADGDVNYKGFQNDREALHEYLDYLSENKPNKKWSVQEQLAYYINTYNAYTLNLILDNYPVKSIRDLDGPWTKAIVPVGDVMMSLAGIENSLLRKMNEPRIHFAINCASFSCPKLLNEAFTAGKINEQLERVTLDFINSEKNEIGENSVRLSSIFDWYKKDFTGNGRTLIEYINQYSNIRINQDAVISFKDYNWNLNEQK